MGGEGSGRPVKPENLIKRQYEQRTPIANDDFFIPNYSGLQEVKKTDPAITGGGPEYPIKLKNGVYKQQTFSNLGAGYNDVYTCPVGKKASIPYQLIRGYNNSALAMTVRFHIKRGGTSYRISNISSSVGAAAGLSLFTYVPIILEAGDIFQIELVTGAGLNVGFFLVEYPEADLDFKHTIITPALDTTVKTIYTVPAGKIAIPCNLSMHYTFLPAGSTTPVVDHVVYNSSGATRNITVYLVPDGQVAGTNYKYTLTQAVSNNNLSMNIAFPPIAIAGDKFQIVSDNNAAGQHSVFSIMELDA